MVGKVGVEPTTSTSRTLRAKPTALLPEENVDIAWRLARPTFLNLPYAEKVGLRYFPINESRRQSGRITNNFMNIYLNEVNNN